MAAFLVIGIIVAGEAATKKYKKRRAAKQKAKQDLAIHVAKENYFQSHKSLEAEEDRQRAEEELMAAQPGSSANATACRRSHDHEIPPPYVKDAPEYEDHYRDARATNGTGHTAHVHPAFQGESVQGDALARTKESEASRRSRLRKQFFRRGDYMSMVGMSLASGC